MKKFLTRLSVWALVALAIVGSCPAAQAQLQLVDGAGTNAVAQAATTITFAANTMLPIGFGLLLIFLAIGAGLMVWRRVVSGRK